MALSRDRGPWRYYYYDGTLRGELVYHRGSVGEASYCDVHGVPVDALPPRSE